MSVISKPDFSMVRKNIETALRLLYKNDHLLITNITEERSITHKFAEYIQKSFSEWHVDCEYNRLGLNRPKAILTQNSSFPDIIIHLRNTNDNLLVVEAKSIHSNNLKDTHDKDKIRAYIEDTNYQYSFGLWICFHDELSETQLDWYENHNGVCREVSL
jgi:hypothetical protein